MTLLSLGICTSLAIMLKYLNRSFIIFFKKLIIQFCATSKAKCKNLECSNVFNCVVIYFLEKVILLYFLIKYIIELNTHLG